jgi:hypothetical protein
VLWETEFNANCVSAYRKHRLRIMQWRIASPFEGIARHVASYHPGRHRRYKTEQHRAQRL